MGIMKLTILGCVYANPFKNLYEEWWLPPNDVTTDES